MDNKVLIIDDEEVILNALGKILSFYKFSVIKASDYTDGLNKFKENLPTLVITDIMLNDTFDGIRLLKQIKSVNKKTEVIVITGYADIEKAINALKYGASDFILKPINKEILMTAVKRAYDKLKLNNELAFSSKLASLGNISYSIAHNLNNLLQIIIGNAEILQYKLKKNADYLDNIITASNKIGSIVKNLLIFGKESDNDNKIDFENVDLKQIVDDSIELINYKMENSNIRIHNNLTKEITISANFYLLKYAIINIFLSLNDLIGEKKDIFSHVIINYEKDVNYNNLIITIKDIRDTNLINHYESYFKEDALTQFGINNVDDIFIKLATLVIESHSGMLIVNISKQDIIYKIKLPVLVEF